jgi:hypothetical protein
MKDRPYITLKLSNPPWIWLPLMSIQSVSGRIWGGRFLVGFGRSYSGGVWAIVFGLDLGYCGETAACIVKFLGVMLRKFAIGPGVLTVFFVVHRLGGKKNASDGDTLTCQMYAPIRPINTTSHIFDTAGFGTGVTAGL